MRILDQSSDRAIWGVLVLLTRDEARELAVIAASLAAGPVGNHEHVTDLNHSHEVTLGLYEVDCVPPQFQTRMTKLIMDDR